MISNIVDVKEKHMKIDEFLINYERSQPSRQDFVHKNDLQGTMNTTQNGDKNMENVEKSCPSESSRWQTDHHQVLDVPPLPSRLKKLKQKLFQIKQLKFKLAKGERLDVNQLAKIQSEDKVLKEISTFSMESH